MMVIEEEWLIQSLVYTKSFPNTVQLQPEGCNVTLWSLDHKKNYSTLTRINCKPPEGADKSDLASEKAE